MTTRPTRALAVTALTGVLTGVLAGGLTLLTAGAAQAHSLTSSTLAVRVGEEQVEATVSVAADTLDAVLGGSPTDAQVSSYLAEHLTVTGTDDSTWTESWSPVLRETVEGIDSYRVDVVLDPGGADASVFTLGYDGVLEADASHEAVVVLTDAAGDISTAGVLTATDDTLTVGDTATGTLGTGLTDMVGYGLHHVLEGADHLLFLFTLLLVAPVVAVAGRWRRGDGVRPTLRSVLAVVTAFTVGHSLTLLASALGWVTAPSAPVEVLIAVSVGVAAVHALRPLARRGEVLVAGGFGLVHGLAFAGILTDLGLGGVTSVPALLAFNVGVELAQLLTVALVFPLLYLLSRTRWYPAVRTTGALIALVAATTWALDRLGWLADPLAGVEETLIANPWWVVAGLALLALVARTTEPSVRQDDAARTTDRCALARLG
ncbi:MULTISPECIES: HupE/UreJ family protein [unclassified Modestobacter]|uniref:HupE/UreJ family protein n=1 Tax=unclassified Modestobacter TaxID=2643866 RepID=UPI0022AAE433|nr:MULTISPECIES: HupE/UreJ family protein [unclassified Modestobacter]MCZ2826871.1 HupE/UreJ family protein [Modestobacter sp. VKM Ac-2981]MCZ2855433.1 HupE/UreJ family protein [Modestobacter sp. VKM Ac-2982]